MKWKPLTVDPTAEHIKPLEYDGGPPTLPLRESRELREALTSILRIHDPPVVERFCISAEVAVAHFVYTQKQKRTRPPSEIRAELRGLAKRLDSIAEALARTSPDALAEWDSVCWLNNNPPEFPTRPDATPSERARLDRLQPIKEYAPWSVHAATELLSSLDAIRSSIERSLELGERAAAGAPYQLHSRNLALDVAGAIQRLLGVAPTADAEGLFTQAFRECLAVGYHVTGSGKRPPEEVHVFIKDAVWLMSRLNSQEK